MSFLSQDISKSFSRYDNYPSITSDLSNPDVDQEELDDVLNCSSKINLIKSEKVRNFFLFLEQNQISIEGRFFNCESQLEQFFHVLDNEDHWFHFNYGYLRSLSSHEVVDSYESCFREIEGWFSRAKRLYERIHSDSQQDMIEEDLDLFINTVENFHVIDSLQNCIDAFQYDYARACSIQMKKDLHAIRQYEDHFALSFFSSLLRFLTHADIDTIESYIFIIKVFQKQLDLLDIKEWEKCILLLHQCEETVENASSMADFCLEYYLKKYPYKLRSDLKKMAIFHEGDALKSFAQAARYTNIVQQAMRQIATMYEYFHNVRQLVCSSKQSFPDFMSIKSIPLRQSWKGAVATQYRMLLALIKKQFRSESAVLDSCEEVKRYIESLFFFEMPEDLHRRAQDCFQERLSEYMSQEVEYTFFGEYNNQPKLTFDMLLQSIEREFPV